MSSLLKIADLKTGGVLRADLTQILQLVPNELHVWSWAILDLELVPGQAGHEAQRAAYLLGDSSRLLLTWMELMDLAHQIHQAQNILIVAAHDLDALKDLCATDELSTTCDLVIELVDTSYWLVYAKDAMLVDTFRTAFADVEELPTSALTRQK